MKTNTLAVFAGIALYILTVGGAQAGGPVPVSISGTKFEDVNGNGQRDMGTDVPFPGITIELFDANDNLIAIEVTDANGDYLFDELIPGEYTVREDLSFDIHNETLPTTATEFMILLESEPATGIDFGNTILGSFHGFKFMDIDLDGILDSNEPGLPGIEFLLFDVAGNVVDSAPTNDNGEFWFEQLLPGEYTISESIINDLLLTTLPNERTFTLLSRQEYVFQDGAAMLPDGSLREEVNVGDELIWGNADVAVPEPSIFFLFGIGLAGMGVARKRMQTA